MAGDEASGEWVAPGAHLDDREFLETFSWLTPQEIEQRLDELSGDQEFQQELRDAIANGDATLTTIEGGDQ